MSEHIPEARLQAFVACELDTEQAVSVAMHLDECPMCSARAAAAEPLAAAFARVADPEVPDDLALCVLEAARQPEPFPWTEVAIGGSLLAAAALLAVFGGDPVGGLVRLGVLADAASTGLAKVALPLQTTVLLMIAATLTTLGFAATRRAPLTRPS